MSVAASERWKITCIGGGTGLPVLLRGFNEWGGPGPDMEITAIVSVSDDGGSSGRIIDDYGTLPPGDFRNCVLALADPSVGPLIRRFFGHRFSGREDEVLEGHSAGNLLILALSQLNKGDFRKTILDVARLFSIRGKILLPTLVPTVLCAVLEDGTEVIGESRIPQRRDRSPIHRVFLRPRDPGAELQAMPEAVEAIMTSDAVVLAPGSLYTSLLPNLLVPGIAEALRDTDALRIQVCNLVTEVGETDGYSVEDHVRAIERHAGFWPDAVVSNEAELDEQSMRRYAFDAFRTDWQVARDAVDEVLASLEGEGQVRTPSEAAVDLIQTRMTYLVEKAARLHGSYYVVKPEPGPWDLPTRHVPERLAQEVEIVDRGISKRVLRHDPSRVVAAVRALLADRE